MIRARKFRVREAGSETLRREPGNQVRKPEARNRQRAGRPEAVNKEPGGEPGSFGTGRPAGKPQGGGPGIRPERARAGNKAAGSLESGREALGRGQGKPWNMAPFGSLRGREDPGQGTRQALEHGPLREPSRPGRPRAGDEASSGTWPPSRAFKAGNQLGKPQTAGHGTTGGQSHLPDAGLRVNGLRPRGRLFRKPGPDCPDSSGTGRQGRQGSRGLNGTSGRPPQPSGPGVLGMEAWAWGLEPMGGRPSGTLRRFRERTLGSEPRGCTNPIVRPVHKVPEGPGPRPDQGTGMPGLRGYVERGVPSLIPGGGRDERLSGREGSSQLRDRLCPEGEPIGSLQVGGLQGFPCPPVIPGMRTSFGAEAKKKPPKVGAVRRAFRSGPFKKEGGGHGKGMRAPAWPGPQDVPV
jgi:hypothetical protein